jgi:multidrug efflux pump subunit AcrB
MTSLAFIVGVAPLVVATGAGAEMRQSLGTAVFGGMLGVTAFGPIFTPAFYTIVQQTGLAPQQKQNVQSDSSSVVSPRAG